MIEAYHWIIFNVVIVCLLFLDLWKARRDPHTISLKEAILTSAGWIGLALLFNLWIYVKLGDEAGLMFLTGYLIEESLSIDNLFVFLVIFSHFKVPDHLKHKVLFYGILGAIVMRALLIWSGLAWIQASAWAFYLFGAFLIYAGFKLAFKTGYEVRHEESIIYRLVSRWIPILPSYENGSFFVKQEGVWKGTLLFLVLLLIETTDLIFALDSVPAVYGITTDPFIVYTSNILAILGLRSLFFVLESTIQRFSLLHYALAVILVFIGCKMILADLIQIPITFTFAVIVISISLALIGSWIFPEEPEEE